MLYVTIPYVILVVIYLFRFKIYHPTPPPGTVSSAIFKILPILYLLALVRLAPPLGGRDPYRLHISTALLFSVGGDLSMNWQRVRRLCFILGVAFFAVAQVTYTVGFGFEHFGGQTAFTFVVAAIIVLRILLPDVRPTLLRPLVVLYIVLLGFMGWRSTVRYKVQRTLDTWLAMTGAVFFIISDFTIGFNKWKVQFSRASLLIMVTYYIAQLLLVYSMLLQPNRG